MMLVAAASANEVIPPFRTDIAFIRPFSQRKKSRAHQGHSGCPEIMRGALSG